MARTHSHKLTHTRVAAFLPQTLAILIFRAMVGLSPPYFSQRFLAGSVIKRLKEAHQHRHHTRTQIHVQYSLFKMQPQCSHTSTLCAHIRFQGKHLAVCCSKTLLLESWAWGIP